ncbi:hypothetical protein RDABS01_032123 [Bienertia sinuspersici]
MNEEILNCPTSKMEFGENLNENKSISRKKTNTFVQSNEKKSFELKKDNENEDENEVAIPMDPQPKVKKNLNQWDDSLNQKLINNIKVYLSPTEIDRTNRNYYSLSKRKELSMNIMLPKKDLTLTDLIKKGILIVKPIRLCEKDDELFIVYHTICISLVRKSKHGYNEKIYSENVDKKIWLCLHLKLFYPLDVVENSEF